LALFAEPLLTVWLGSAFAREAAPLVPILALGVLINGLAHAPYAYVQAHDRPDLTARLHLIEAPAYLATLVVLLQAYGLAGAAWAWVLRVAVDAFGLSVLVRLSRRWTIRNAP
jgi:O-antigen/teichoic acid export membrane protein